MEVRKHPRFPAEFGSTFGGGFISRHMVISNLSLGESLWTVP